MLLVLLPPHPPPNTPLVFDETPANPLLPIVRSPKSVALPGVAMVI